MTSPEIALRISSARDSTSIKWAAFNQDGDPP